MPEVFARLPLVERLASHLTAADPPMYLVGGVVRDLLLNRPVHDVDLVVQGDALRTARLLGNRIGAAYYPMDVEHQTARLVLVEPDGPRQVIDFAGLRGSDLESDLRLRDFTINAMALDLRDPQQLIDPLGGASDLRHKQLRACSPNSFLDDPNRVLRALRQAQQLHLQIEAETRSWLRQAAPRLPNVSAERVRDELWRILGGQGAAIVIRSLDLVGALPYVLPELGKLKGVQQSAPHVLDVWEHTLDLMARLETLLDLFSPQPDPDRSANLSLGLATMRLGRYRTQVQQHLQTSFTPERSLRPLLFFAALYHDVAKPEARTLDAAGRTHFYEHDELGAQTATQRASSLRLSNDEVERIGRIVRQHMRPLLLGQTGKQPSRKAIYRFYRVAGPAGVDICLLSLADFLATYGATLSAEAWGGHLDVVRSLLEAWWEKSSEMVAPPGLVNGSDLMHELKLTPGRQVGALLEAIREAQAMGQVSTRSEALLLAQKILNEEISPYG